MSEPISKTPKLSIDSEVEMKQDVDNELTEEKAESSDDEFPLPEDCDASSMLVGVDLSSRWLSVADRYFVPFYKLDVLKPGDDICIRVHTNRICMLSLAPSHAIFQQDSQIEKINFRVSDKLDRTKNHVSGKGKRGAQPLQENSNICSITCANGDIYLIKCCMTGKLVEVNESLATEPSLLKEPPHKGGYLAIVLPNIRLIEDLKKSLLSEEGYQTALQERRAKSKLNEIKHQPQGIVVQG